MIELFSSIAAWIKINWVIVMILGAAAGAFIFLRTQPSNIDDTTELAAILQDGQPTIIEFYSNF